MSNIFNLLIIIGGTLILIGLFYTFFWSNKNKIEPKKEYINYKTVDDTSLLTITGNSYKPFIKKPIVSPINEKVEEKIVEVSSYDKVIDDYKGEENEDPLSFFNNREEQYIDPVENIEKYSNFNSIDFEKVKNEIYNVEKNTVIENQNEKNKTITEIIPENIINSEIDFGDLD